MGDQIDNIVIAELKPWDFVVCTERLLTPDEIAERTDWLRKAAVPGIQEWMLSVPRRWFN